MTPSSAWRDSVTLPTYALASLAGALSVVAVGEINATPMLHPAYFAGMNGGVTAPRADPIPTRS